MADINVNEYVRTESGRILKMTETNIVGKYYDMDIQPSREIIKHSKNIIDLIEVGDYVNRMLVVSVTEIILDDKSIKEKIVFVNRDENCTLKPLQISNEDIKTIVTKEQFASMEYRLEV